MKIVMARDTIADLPFNLFLLYLNANYLKNFNEKVAIFRFLELKRCILNSTLFTHVVCPGKWKW